MNQTARKEREQQERQVWRREQERKFLNREIRETEAAILVVQLKRKELDIRAAGLAETLNRLLDERKKDAAADPQPGDLWTEMLSHYVYVIEREGDRVTCLHGSPPVEFPEGGQLWEGTAAEFGRAWGGDTLMSRNNDVSGWMDRWRAGRVSPPRDTVRGDG
jgi:hypothetical protein